MPTQTPITEVEEQDVLIVTYADDTADLTKSKSILAATFALQECLDPFHQWIWSKKLTFGRHITCIPLSFRTIVDRVAWLLAQRNKLALGEIFKSILAPNLFYGLQVYGIAARTNLNKIRALQAKTLRRISGAPWIMRTRDIERDLNVPKLGDKLQELARKYMEKLNELPNSLARKLGTAAINSAEPNNRIKRRLKRHHPQDLPDRILT